MEKVDRVTVEDLDKGNFQITMRSGYVGWITKDKIILPGRDIPAQSNLAIVKCQVDKKLQFNYLDSDNVGSIVSQNSKVADIIRHDLQA